MLKMLTACTSEIDEVEAAVAEILEQLDLDGGLLTNSVGILSCFSEFVDTGVVEALCAKLPFDVVGETTLGNATAVSCGLEQLSLSVLTSDDLSFSTAFSAPIDGQNWADAIDDAYANARAKLPGDPALVLAFAPMAAGVGGERMLARLDACSGAAPVYGGISCDHTMGYRESRTIWNGRAERKSMAIALVHGAIEPRFFIVSISENKLQKQKAVITDAEGETIKTVNGIPFASYLAERGLTIEGGVEATASVPFLVGGEGELPLARALYETTPEGYGVFGCKMPVGAALWMGSIDYADILETTGGVVREALDISGTNGILMFPCLSRSLMLEPNADHEMKKVMGIIGDTVPFHLAYVGGEMCPTPSSEGVPRNSFHNFTYTVCTF